MTIGHLFNNITRGGTDEDFVAEKDDEGSPVGDSGLNDSDASQSGDEKEKPAKKEPKKDLSSKASASTSKRKSKDADEDGKKKKYQMQRDPNAPRRARPAFMFFAQRESENLKKNNPGISFRGVSRVLGEKWKKMSAEEKEPFEAKARVYKKRYLEIGGY